METIKNHSFICDIEATIGQQCFFSHIINSINALVHIDDLDTKKMLWGNNYFKEATGFSAQEICDMGTNYICKYYHPDDLKRTNEIVDFFKKEKGEHHTTLFKLKHKNGEWVSFYTTRSILKRKPNGDPWLVLSVSLNITIPVNEGTQIAEMYIENTKLRSKLLASTFTKKELEVLQLLCKGFNSQQIADKLFISQRTVQNHRYKINIKANCKNITQLLNFATNNGLA